MKLEGSEGAVVERPEAYWAVGARALSAFSCFLPKQPKPGGGVEDGKGGGRGGR